MSRMRSFGAALVLPLVAAACAAAADEIVPPASPLQASGPAEFVYRLDRPAAGDGTLALDWTDAVGRVVERRQIAVTPAAGRDIRFALDLRRAVVLSNAVHARFSLGGEATAPFIVAPAGNLWSDAQIIMWQGQSPDAFVTLQTLGISAGELHPDRDNPSAVSMDEAAPLLASGLPWYVENIATDFYAAYHRFFPGRPPNWRFTELVDRYKANPHDPALLMRDPSLSDARWQADIRDRLIATVKTYRPYRPLYYDLADEGGIADLAAFWDFDFSPESLQGMRDWLKSSYGSLSALNAEWGSAFAAWDEVRPLTTPEAFARRDGNYAAWADFKAWMDVAYARAVQQGRDAVHAGDPQAVAAIEGGQVPGWGGYDYALLSRSADAMEIYDSGGNIDIVRSLAPDVVVLTTSFLSGRAEEHRVWRETLRGVRGLVLWDARREFVQSDGSVGERGGEAGPYFRELRRGIAAQLFAARPERDPVAILYSPASMRTQWLLDWKDKGDAWSGRNSELEGANTNTYRSAFTGYLDAVARLGLTPRIVTAEMVAAGELERQGDRALILPDAVSLSASAAAAIRGFAARGGLVVADRLPGAYDEHSRRLDVPALSGVALAAPDAVEELGSRLAAARVAAAFPLATAAGAPVGDVETYRYRDGGVTVVALQRQLADGKPAAGGSVVLRLAEPAYVYDLRGQRALGRQERVTVALDPVDPAIFALSPRPLAAPHLAMPQSVLSGADAELRLAPDGPADDAMHVIHVEAIDPSGQSAARYARNLLAAGGVASMLLPFAASDPPGQWQIRATDLLSGQTATTSVTLAN